MTYNRMRYESDQFYGRIRAMLVHPLCFLSSFGSQDCAHTWSGSALTVNLQRPALLFLLSFLWNFQSNSSADWRLKWGSDLHLLSVSWLATRDTKMWIQGKNIGQVIVEIAMLCDPLPRGGLLCSGDENFFECRFLFYLNFSTKLYFKPFYNKQKSRFSAMGH